MKLTSSQIADLTNPLFAVHPDAKPVWISISRFMNHWKSTDPISGDGNDLLSDDAELILQAYLTTWLAKKGERPTISHSTLRSDSENPFSVCTYRGLFVGQSILHALVAAALAVPKSPQ